MDPINSIQNSQSIQGTSQQQVSRPHPPPPPGNEPSSQPYNLQLSSLGQLFHAAGEAGEPEKAKAFHESLLEAMEKGDFKTETFMKTVSDEIKAYASELGINLEQALDALSANPEQLQGFRPPPPPADGKDPQGPPPNRDDLRA